MGVFPARLWNPATKESREFAKADDVPAGWLDHHPDDPAHLHVEPPPPEPPAPAVQLSRSEITKELRRRQIKYDPKWDTDQLYNLLLAEVEKEV